MGSVRPILGQRGDSGGARNGGPGDYLRVYSPCNCFGCNFYWPYAQSSTNSFSSSSSGTSNGTRYCASCCTGTGSGVNNNYMPCVKHANHQRRLDNQITT